MPDDLGSGGRGPNLQLALGHIRQIKDTEKVRAQSSNVPRQPNAFKNGTQNRPSQMALAVKRISKPLTKKEQKKSVEGSNSRLNHIQDLSTAPISFVKSPSVKSNVGDADVVETKYFVQDSVKSKLLPQLPPTNVRITRLTAFASTHYSTLKKPTVPHSHFKSFENNKNISGSNLQESAARTGSEVSRFGNQTRPTSKQTQQRRSYCGHKVNSKLQKALYSRRSSISKCSQSSNFLTKGRASAPYLSGQQKQKGMPFMLNLTKVGVCRPPLKQHVGSKESPYQKFGMKEQDTIEESQFSTRLHEREVHTTTRQSNIMSPVFSQLVHSARGTTPCDSTEHLNGANEVKLKQNRLTTPLLASPNKPDFTVLAQREAYETYLSLCVTSSGGSEANISSCSISPVNIQDKDSPIKSELGKSRDQIQVAGKKFNPGGSVSPVKIRAQFDNIKTSSNNAAEVSRVSSPKLLSTGQQRRCALFDYCCLAPQQTNSENQLKFTTPTIVALGLSNNMSACNFNSQLQLISSTSVTKVGNEKTVRQQLAPSKSYIPRLPIFEEKIMKSTPTSQVRNKFRFDVKSSKAHSESSIEVSEVPSEGLISRDNHQLKRQNSLNTMTLQNLNLCASQSRIVDSRDQVSQYLHAEFPQKRQIRASGTAQSLVKYSKCTQSFHEMTKETQEHRSSTAMEQNLPQTREITAESPIKVHDQPFIANLEPPRLLIQSKKSTNLFNTPKHPIRSINRSLLLGAEQPNHSSVKRLMEKPTLPSTVSMPAFQSDKQTDDVTQCTMNPVIEVVPYGSDSRRDLRQRPEFEGKAGVNSQYQTNDTPNQRAGLHRAQHQIGQNVKSLKTKAPISPIRVFQEHECTPSNGIKHNKRKSYSSALNSTQMYCEETMLPQNETILPSRDEQQPKIEQNGAASQNKTMTSNRLSNSQLRCEACRRIMDPSQAPDSVDADDQALNTANEYNVVQVKPRLSNATRNKTIDAFIQRQRDQESQRQSSISQKREKKFISETASELQSHKKKRNSCGTNKSEKKLSSNRAADKDLSDSDSQQSNFGQKVGFLKRMALDIEKRSRYTSPKPFSSVTPRGSITLTVTGVASKTHLIEEDGPRDDAYLEQSRNTSLGQIKSARSNPDLSRLLRPIGNFSTSLKKKIQDEMQQTALEGHFKYQIDQASVPTRLSERSLSKEKALGLVQVRESMLAKARQHVKPGKVSNDKIMLHRLEQELQPLQRKAAQSIVELDREDFRKFLFDLEMLVGPEPVQRDEQDAQDLLDILFDKDQQESSPAHRDAIAKQTLNQERMAVFTSLVKALLLHVTDPSLVSSVKDTDRQNILNRVNLDSEYRDYLADKFFVFYLNRTRALQARTDSAQGLTKSNHKQLEHQMKLYKQQSLESRYIEKRSSRVATQDLTVSDIMDKPQDFNETQEGEKSVSFKKYDKVEPEMTLTKHKKAQEPKRLFRSLKKQKEHAQRLIDSGVKQKQERDTLRKHQEEEEIKDMEQYEKEKKSRLASYPWVEEEMVGRKTDCCLRLHVDGLRRNGLPLPEFEPQPTTLELLDIKFEVPSIYQAIQQDGHASFDQFQSIQTKYEGDLLQSCLEKYQDLRVPKEEHNFCDLGIDDDIEALGNLPVLVINLQTEKLAQKSEMDLPNILLYEDDQVVEKVQAYCELWPLPEPTKINLVEHIAFKIELLSLLQQ